MRPIGLEGTTAEQLRELDDQLFSSIDTLLEATHEFFVRYNHRQGGMHSIIGADHSPQDF